MMVSVESEMPRYVSYSVLRNPVQQVSAIVPKTEDDDDDDGDSIPRPPAPKKPRSQKEKPLEIDMINLIPVLPDGDTRTSVPLTCAPCTNGILSREDRRQTPRVEQLEYNPKHCVHDDEVSVSPNNFYLLKISAVKNGIATAESAAV